MMRIWIDADACPGAVKEIVIRAAERLRVPVFFVANKPVSVPRSELIFTVQVSHGADVADEHIAKNAKTGDLAVTQDIPLAAILVKMGVVTLGLRGETFTEDNIDERLSIRDFMHELRDGGVMTGGPKGFGQKERQQFAAALDRELTRLVRLSENSQ